MVLIPARSDKPGSRQLRLRGPATPGSGHRAFVAMIAIVSASSALFCAWLVLRFGGRQLTTAVDDLGQAVAALIAATAGLIVVRREHGRIRRGWCLLALGELSFGIGQTIYSWDEVVTGHRPTTPSAADPGFLLALALSLGAMLVFFSPPVGLTSRIRAVVDALIVSSGLLLASWLTVLSPAFAEPAGSLIAQAMGLTYLVGTVVILTTVVIVAQRSRSVERLPLTWIMVGLTAIAGSNGAFVYLTEKGAYAASRLVDCGWFVGFLILALAAIKPPAAKLRRVRVHDSVLLPYVPVLGGIALVAERLTQGDRLDTFGTWCMLAVFLFVIVRQLLALRENRALTEDLESQVHARTLQLRLSEQRLSSVIQSVSDVISVISADGTILYTSPSARRLLGHRETDLTGGNLFAFVHPDDRARAAAFFAYRSANGGAGRRLELRLRSRDESWRHTETVATQAVDDPAAETFVLATRDVTEQKNLERQLAHHALHDPLTGLANRSLFATRVENALARTRRSGTQLAVLFVDLDEFKSVNDTLGHASGDELLREVADRLRVSARAHDTVSRLGGDEFGLLLEDCDEHAAVRAAERLRRALAPAVLLDDHEIAPSASAGIAIGGPSTESASELLRNADIAMYSAKACGKGCHDLFRTEMRDAVVDRVNLLGDLRRALERQEFELYYQPLVELSTNRIAGFEALLRWHHASRGDVPPVKFIPIAEDTGLIVPIGRWVLARAVAQLCQWSTPGSGELTISVNVSGRQFMSEGFRASVEEVLEDSELDPARLTLELTESTLLGSSEETITRLRELKRLGVKLAIDDFGTGFSSLSYLQRLPVDAIKIDKSFVDHIDTTRRAGDLARSVIALGNALALDVVAEGVESGSQAALLGEIGCRLGQGYLFSRPLPHAQAHQLLRRGPAAEPASPPQPGCPSSSGGRDTRTGLPALVPETVDRSRTALAG